MSGVVGFGTYILEMNVEIVDISEVIKMENRTLWSHTKFAMVDGQRGFLVTSQIFVPEKVDRKFDDIDTMKERIKQKLAEKCKDIANLSAQYDESNELWYGMDTALGKSLPSQIQDIIDETIDNEEQR